MYYSPLLYPCGKTRLARVVASICDENNIHTHYVEPYAGDASVALYLLRTTDIKKITINNADRSIYAFWHSLFYETQALCQLIEETSINMQNWEYAKKIQAKKETEDLLSLGFSTFFLNRTHVSPIQDGSPLRQKNNKEEYKIRGTFNQKPLIGRIHKIVEHAERVTICNLDPLALVQDLQKKVAPAPPIFYFDSRHDRDEKHLHDHDPHNNHHQQLSKAIRNMQDISWLLAYDDQDHLSNIYRWVSPQQRVEYVLANGKEVMLFSENLKVSYFPFQKIK